MKQKDIALIIVIAVVAAVVSFVASGIIFVTPSNRQQKVEVAPVITSNFPTLSTKYFNSKSIDPTQTIQIGTSTNPTPFSNGQ